MPKIKTLNPYRKNIGSKPCGRNTSATWLKACKKKKTNTPEQRKIQYYKEYERNQEKIRDDGKLESDNSNGESQAITSIGSQRLLYQWIFGQIKLHKTGPTV